MSDESPKTAEQINLPQTGKVDTIQTPPLAPRVPASTLDTPQPVAEVRVGSVANPDWWSIDTRHAANRGTAENAVKEIQDCKKVPAVWKAALLDAIANLKCSAVEVHAHCTPDDKSFTLNIRINKLF